jgi:hypothetical protein
MVMRDIAVKAAQGGSDRAWAASEFPSRNQGKSEGSKARGPRRKFTKGYFDQPTHFLIFPSSFSVGSTLTGQITIYETNNTPFPHQYRRWLRSTVSRLRQHAEHLAKQRGHARRLRV